MVAPSVLSNPFPQMEYPMAVCLFPLVSETPEVMG